jgi:hypothetical protein
MITRASIGDCGKSDYAEAAVTPGFYGAARAVANIDWSN